MSNMSIQAFYEWYRNVLRNSKYRWWVILGTLVYLISPIDLVPDVLFPFGLIDDVAVLTLLLSEVTQMMVESAKRRQRNPKVTTEKQNGATVEVNAVSIEE